ncbi:MAG: site-specific DNA-methyltransferase [Acidobacteriota bacterium]|nr:site-specific DNA-methyltransferase [Acidobacteriota bacterium]
MFGVAKQKVQPSPPAIQDISRLDQALLERFDDRMRLESSLSRSLVSFQANKTRSGYRWYKYKEAFSAALIESLLDRYQITSGKMLDPFAGSGTALFVASAAGLQAEGIELLPIGQQIIQARKLLEESFTENHAATLGRWIKAKPWQKETAGHLPELRITRGAYPPQTHEAIGQYLSAVQGEDAITQSVLRFALLCVLESVSYTRKDGQYLRWDHRSDRRQGSRPFDKGFIVDFEAAITAKLAEMLGDWRSEKEPPGLFPIVNLHGGVWLKAGSCLEVMPTLAAEQFDVIVTSPPYCNRYDYTRTYALELALLGIGEQELIGLRQEMLSCTVENRAKDLLAMNSNWHHAITAADEQSLLQAVLSYLEEQKAKGELNNQGIPRMVRGYFYEMACVIAESARVMKRGARLVMVNDNVRYAGASISVDLILSALAERLGFEVESILVLPDGKGNSSQQMGEHGREALRKCVYVWRKV